MFNWLPLLWPGEADLEGQQFLLAIFVSLFLALVSTISN